MQPRCLSTGSHGTIGIMHGGYVTGSSASGETHRCVMRRSMRRLVLLGLVVLLISGCSFKQMWKWIEDAEWEREDKTITIVDFSVR